MGLLTLIFHGRLNDFLRDYSAEDPITYTYTQKTGLKHIIEVLGVPHPEVGQISLNGRNLGLEYIVQDQDIVHIYPRMIAEHQFDTDGPRFVLDNHLGKLADYLRLLGFDVIYAQDWLDEQIANFSHAQQRILLTRDRGLLKRKIVEEGYCVRSDFPQQQLAEIVEQYHLSAWVTPFKRCPRCNGKLTLVTKEKIIDQLLPLTRKYYDEFTQCQDCGQIYWKGSHFQNMQTLFEPYLGNHQEER